MGTAAVFAVIVLYFCFAGDGFIESAVKAFDPAAVGEPGRAVIGEDDAHPERAVFQAPFDKAACGDLFKVMEYFALRQAQGTAALEGVRCLTSRWINPGWVTVSKV